MKLKIIINMHQPKNTEKINDETFTDQPESINLTKNESVKKKKTVKKRKRDAVKK